MSFVRTYLHPFRSPKLAVTYLSLLLGMLGQGFLFLYLAVDMAKIGYGAVVSFYESWFLTAGLVFFPLFFTIMKTWGRTALIAIVIALEVMGMVALLLYGHTSSPLALGFIIALFATGYWQMHHLNIAGHTSSHSRGFEVSLAKIIMQVGGILGSALAAFAMGVASMDHLPSFAFLFVFAATFGLIATLPRIHDGKDDEDMGSIRMENITDVFKSYPRQNLATFLEAIYEMYIQILLPVWLTFMGISGAVIGVLQTMKGAVTALCAPFTGSVIHKGRGEEFTIAAASGTGGCLAILTGGLAMIPLVIASLLWAVSRLAFQTGLESRWYSRRSMTQILIREIMLTLGRAVSIPAIAWIAFFAPAWYMPLGVVLCLLVWPAGRHLTACARESAL